MGDSKKPSKEASDERDTHMAEWQVARDVLQSTDNNLHDLRKFGFSFVTSLLAAESILLPSVAGGLPDDVKLGAYLATLLLIFVLHLIDENYRVLENAAAQRALVIERELNIELTDIITDRFNQNQVKQKVFRVYSLFALAVWVLALFTFKSAFFYVTVLGVFTIVDIYLMRQTSRNVKLTYRFGEGRDWTISPHECKEGDLVKITLTNLTAEPPAPEDLEHLNNPSIPPESMLAQASLQRVPKPIHLLAKVPIWRIEDEDGNEVETKVEQKDLWIYHSYSWFWDTKDVLKGDKKKVFSVHPLERVLPLDRKITVTSTENRQSWDSTDA